MESVYENGIVPRNSLKSLAKLFNGGKHGILPYKKVKTLIHFFNANFDFHDVYSSAKGHYKRLDFTYDKLLVLWSERRIDVFVSAILSPQYLSVIFPEKQMSELRDVSQALLEYINIIFKGDEMKIVESSSDLFEIIPLKSDEVRLGSGAYADCYLIKSSGLVEKRLNKDGREDAESKSRFKREFEVTKSLGDIDGVIKVYEYDSATLSYTMEKADDTLQSLIIGDRLDSEAKKKAIIEIANIMKEVHGRGVLHRDLSPTNILYFSGHFKISDFGLCKNLNAHYSYQTAKTGALGHFAYCDPRQYNQLIDADVRSDVYSIGKIINFIFTKNPDDYNHPYKVVSQKATCDVMFRYCNLNQLLDGLRKVDLSFENKNHAKDLSEKIDSGDELDEIDASYISMFNGREIYNWIKDRSFISAFLQMAKNGLISEDAFIDKLRALIDFGRNDMYGFPFDCCDRFGYLGIAILRGDAFAFPIKELAVDLINIPIEANRYGIKGLVRRKILGNIDPLLEERIDPNIRSK